MFGFSGLNDDELRRWAADGHPISMVAVFVHVEARLTVADGDLLIFTEDQFPVLDLAAELVRWTRTPGSDRGDLVCDDFGLTDPGAVRIVRSGTQWRVGSVFAPETWSRPVTTEEVDQLITGFATELVGACKEQLGISVTGLT
ncbi:hypothetical protein D5S17_08875 [Pseudonocardiaceae bacterium YIM PH 21723]|nr:hypothetical protein D5S17_08875 [Pseudonocardiaceae bacterium YIM PH 21723]